MRNKVAAVGLVLSVLLWIAAGAGHASRPSFARARALVDQGKAAEAYEVLAPLEAQPPAM